MTLNIALPDDLVKKADKLAKREYKNRSELIREALIRYIEEKDNWEKIFAWGDRAGKKIGIKSEEDVDKIFFDFRHGKKK